MSTYSDLVLSSAPSLYMPLDDAAVGTSFGNVLDISGNGHVGIPIHPAIPSVVGAVRGHPRMPYLNNEGAGTVGNRRFEVATTLSGSATGSTWECWFIPAANFTSVPYPFIWCATPNDYDDNAMGLYYDAGGTRFIFRAGNFSAGRDIITPARPSHPTGLCHLVCVQQPGGACQVFLNGVAIGAGGGAYSTWPPTMKFVIGGVGGVNATARQAYGRISNVAIYQTALSAETIAAHYQAGLRSISGVAPGYSRVYAVDADALTMIGSAIPDADGSYTIGTGAANNVVVTALRAGNAAEVQGPVQPL